MVQLPYGTNPLDVSIPGSNVTVIKPRHLPGFPDEKKGFIQAINNPTGGETLSSIVQDGHRVAVIIPDGTRPLPFKRLLTWLFEALSSKRAVEFIIVVGTGSHRANTREELIQMMGPEIVKKYLIVNHNAHEPSTMCQVGHREDGQPVLMNREAAEADIRIAVGFIEPHFMAGFSGGYKAVMPGIADIESIMCYHGAKIIADPSSTWGILKGNPTQQIIQRYGTMLPIHFLINVTMNSEHQITAYYCGDPVQAHYQGCAAVKEQMMQKVKQRFPIVITTNNGFPLDQNLYQAVKGMTAANRIVTPNGLIIQAARCDDGYPEHGNFKSLLQDYKSPRDLLDAIESPGFSVFDQWQTQILAMILCHARVGLYSDMTDQEVEQAFLIPIHDIEKAIQDELDRIWKDAPIAVLPEGFMAVPYLDYQL